MVQIRPLFDVARRPSAHFGTTDEGMDTGVAIALAIGSLAAWGFVGGVKLIVRAYGLPFVVGDATLESTSTMMGFGPAATLAIGAVGMLLSAVMLPLLVGGVLYLGVVVGTHAAGRWLLGVESFAATAEAVATAVAVFALVGWIPFVEPVVAVYATYVGVVGLRERHGVTTWQAAAMGSPLVVTAGLYALLMLWVTSRTAL